MPSRVSERTLKRVVGVAVTLVGLYYLCSALHAGSALVFALEMVVLGFGVAMLLVPDLFRDRLLSTLHARLAAGARRRADAAPPVVDASTERFCAACGACDAGTAAFCSNCGSAFPPPP